MALALLAGAAWVPFIAAPLSPDEGGFLLVASQWEPGTSLYGHYWVDRPPLLLSIFDLASHLGGAVGLRLIGIAAVLASVALAALLARTVAGPRALAPTAVAAVFLSTPLFGTTQVDGELLAVPLVLAGVYALARAWQAGSHRAVAWSTGAGVAGMGAALVKQNVVDVFVVAGVLVLLSARHRGLRRTVFLASGVGAGAISTLVGALLVSEARGTEPAALWDALVLFRAHAASVIQASASASTSARFDLLLEAALLSGAPVLIAVLAVRVIGPSTSDSPDLRAPALLLLVWEVAVVAAGGSYWLHYLIGLVPGMVLLATAAAQRGPRLTRCTAVAVGAAAASCVAAVVVWSVLPQAHSSDVAVATYLRSHGSRHDTVVVAFGHPDIVFESGLRSPYEELWSLPVRVRDSSLVGLTGVLRSRLAPTWVVVAGSSLATWGVDADTAQRALDARYRPVTSVGSYVVWHREHPGRPGQADRGVETVEPSDAYSEPSVSEASWCPGSLGSASGPVSVASSFVSPSAWSSAFSPFSPCSSASFWSPASFCSSASFSCASGTSPSPSDVSVVEVPLLVSVEPLSALAATTPPMPRAPTIEAAAMTAALRRSRPVMVELMEPPGGGLMTPPCVGGAVVPLRVAESVHRSAG